MTSLVINYYIRTKYNNFWLLNISNLKKYDNNGMYKVYDMWPEIANKSFENNLKMTDFQNITHIVFAGMGGSGALGDVFSAILSKTNIHVSVVKGYLLPRTVDSKTLIVTTSVSGNTIETLNVLDSAKKMGCKLIAFSSGGKMEEYCKKENVNYRKICMYHSPRASFVSFLYSMLKVMKPFLPIQNIEIEESLKKLKETRDKISSSNLTNENPSISLAKWINGIPLIYYPLGLQSAAVRFKNSFQENSKTHSMIEDIIETCHNGIVSWEKKSNVQPILLQGEEDYVKTKERWKIIKQYFNENNISFKEIYSEKGNILTKLINLIYVLDYASIYNAVLNNIEPSSVRSINYVKKNL
jgi:glucose/mannose-6-phosphate isomerase